MSIYYKRLTRRLTNSIDCHHHFLSRRTFVDRKGPINHYEALGVNSNASSKEIKTAFYRLSKKHHPDVNPDDANAVHKFSIISNAYDILGDPSKRRDYDNELSSRTSMNDPYVTYDRTSSYAQRARAHRPSSWKPPPSSRNASNGFPGTENAFGSSQYGTFNKEQYDAAFGRYRGPSPSGRSTVYDFDEFYRAHYNDFSSFASSRKEAQERARQQRQTEQERREQRANRSPMSKFSSVAIWFSVGVFLIFFSNLVHDMHFQQPTDEIRAKFYIVPKSNKQESSSTK